jgi:hypothetical protein
MQQVFTKYVYHELGIIAQRNTLITASATSLHRTAEEKAPRRQQAE